MKNSAKIFSRKAVALALALAMVFQFCVFPGGFVWAASSFADETALEEEQPAPAADEPASQEAGIAADAPTGVDALPSEGDGSSVPSIDEAASLPADAVSRPAQTLKAKVGETWITLTAPEGSLPAGSTLVAKKVDAAAVAEAVEAAAEAQGKDVADMMAVDLTILDAESNETQPAIPVQVKFVNAGMASDDVSVYHIDDATGAAQPVKTTQATAQVQQFKAEGFSVYVIVDEGDDARISVKFMSGETEIASMWVKSGDVSGGKVDGSVLYDPGVGVLASGVEFKGWTTDADYTAQTKALAIDGVRSEVAGMLPPAHDGDEVVYHAVLLRSYDMTYIDETGASLGQEAVEYRADLGAGAAQVYEVSMPYTPADDEHGFQGWLVAEGASNIADHDSSANDGQGTLYPNEAQITVTGNVTFSVNAPEGHWLVFNENGSGGTYNAPQFVEAGKATSEPALEMVRNGYTFGGWYDEPACRNGHEFAFGGQLTDKTTVYAKWIPNTTAGYTIIIWKQKTTGDGYDFEEAIAGEGTVGNAIPGVTQQGNGDNAYARINGANKQYAGFHLDRLDQNVTIKTEGNSVLNVYYTRNTVTMNFYTYGYGYTQNNNGNYALVDGVYVRLSTGTTRYYLAYADGSPVPTGTQVYYRNNNRWYSTTDPTATGTTYYASNNYSAPLTWTQYTGGNSNRYNRGNGWRIAQTFTGLYGATLADSGYTWDTTHDWHDGYSGDTASGARTTFLDAFLIPGGASSKNFYGEVAQPGNSIVEFYKQNASMDGYTLANTVSSNLTNTSFSISDKYGGFTADHYEIDGVTTQLGDKDGNGYYATGVAYGGKTLRVYFNRSGFKLNFMDGAYVDGNNNVMTEPSQGQLSVVDGVSYGADISSYSGYRPDSAPAGYVFEGWFTDSACTQPYSFTTMPEGGLTVYAKWRQTQYRVFLHPNAGTDTSLDWGSNSQQMNFRVAYGGEVSLPTGRRHGYEFVGWYTDEACTKLFKDSFRLNETTVTTPYDKTTHMTDPMDQWGNITGAGTNSDATGFNGGERFWITKELNLYAKWRTTLDGANGIGVLYDLNGGSGTAADGNLYVDNATADAAPAVTGSAGKRFDHWVMQRWDEASGSYVDVPGSVIYPAGSYSVLAENARMSDVTYGPDGTTIESATYTVQLRAEYVDVEESTPTYIPWFDNKGNAAFHIDTLADGQGDFRDSTLGINEGVDIQPARTAPEGSSFAGWARVETGSTVADSVAFVTNTGNYMQTGLTPWLYYNSADDKFYTDAAYTKQATRVAADEGAPYHALFAVYDTDVEVEVVGSDDAKTYNGSEQSNDAYTVVYKVGGQEVAESDLPEGITATTAITAAKGTDVGSYSGSVTVTLSGSAAGYVIKTPSASADLGLEITRKSVTVRADDASKFYGESDPDAFGAAVTGLLGSDTVSYTVSREPGEDVGTYAITPAGDEEQGNYTVTYLPGTFSINSRDITVTAENKSKTYGEADPELTYSISGAASPAFEDEIRALLEAAGAGVARTAGEDVGTYAVAPSGPATLGNYSVTYAPGTLTVNPKEVTVVAVDNGKAYGAADPELAATVTGLAGDDAIDYSVARAAGENVGTYAVTPSGEAAQGNYTVTYVAGTFTISKAALTVTANDAGKVYGENDPELTATVSGLANGDAESVISYTVSRAEGEDVDTYAITPSGPAELDNYTVEYVNGTFTITKAQITIDIVGNTAAATYTGSEHEASGYIATSESSLFDASKVSYSGDASAAGTDAGTYSMGLDSEKFSYGDTNVEAVFVIGNDGLLTISPAEVTLTASSDTTTYTGSEQTVSGFTSSVAGLTFEGVAASGAGTDAGEYSVTFSGVTIGETKDTSGNYVVADVEPGTLTIEKAALKVEAEDKSKTYDNSPETDPALTATVTGLKGGDAESIIEYTLSREPGQDVGDYAITPAGPAGLDNYTVTYIPATFHIAKTALVVTAVDSGKTYGEDDPALAAAISGVPSGIGEAAVRELLGLSVARDAGENVGTYVETVSGATTLGNYTVAYVPGSFTISPAEVTLTASSDTTTYTGSEQSVSGFTSSVAGLTFEGVAASGAGTDAGAYDVTFSGVTIGETKDTSGNYVVADVELGTLTIDPKAVTITVDNKTKVYGAADPAFTGTVEGLVNEGDLGAIGYSRTNEDEAVGTYADVLDASYTPNSNYAVTVNKGSITITKAQLTITAKPQAYTYNAAPQGPAGTYTSDLDEHVSVEGLVGSDALTSVTLSGEKTEAGAYEGEIVPSVALIGEASGNYEISYVPATLTIQKAEAEVVITGNHAELDYIGSEQVVTGYALSVSNALYKADDFTAPAQGDAKAARTDVGTTKMGLSADQFTNNNSNFDITFRVAADGYITIKAIDVTVTIKGSNTKATYDGAEHTAAGYTATASSDLYDVERDFTFSGAAEAARTDVGTTKMGLSADQFASTNTNFSTVTFVVEEDGFVTIDPAAVTVKANNGSKTYDNDPTNPAGYTATVTGLIGSDTIGYSVAREAGEGVGEYAVTPSGDELQGNYKVSYEAGTFTINPKAVTVTANDVTKTYDGQPAETDGATVEGLVGTDAIDYTVAFGIEDVTNVQETVGAIVASGEPVQGNYTVTYVPGKLTITKAKVTIKADDKTKIYDNDPATDPELTATVVGVPAGAAAPVYGLSRAAGQDVDEYAISVNVDTSAAINKNYDVTVEGGTFAITPVEVTIKADDQTKVYDNDPATDPELTATVTGVPAGGVAPVYSLSRESGQDVGEYAITVTAEASSNPNYTVNTEPGTFSITKTQLTVTVTGNTSAVTYNGAEQSVAGYTVSIPEGADFAEDDIAFSGEALAKGTDAGEYPMGLDASQLSVESNNFTVTFELAQDGRITIAPAAVTLTATSDSKVYTGSEQSISGFDSSVEGLAFEGVSATGAGTAVGEYGVTFTGVTVNETKDSTGNYVVTEVIDGTLAIAKASITIDVTGAAASKVYNGAEQKAEGYEATSESALFDAGKVAFTGDATAEGTDVGTYPMGLAEGQFSYSDDNIDAAFSVADGSLEITRRAVTVEVTGNNDTKTYDGKAHAAVGYTTEISDPLYTAADFTFSGTDVATRTEVGQTDMGLKAEQFANASGNFEVTFTVVEDGFMKIAPALVTVKADDLSKTYGEADPELAAAVTGAIASETIDYSVSRVEGEDVGEYAITVTAGENPNYVVTVVGGTFTITKKAVTITVADSSKIYGTDDPAFSGTVEGLANEDDLGEIAYNRTNTDEAVGTYADVLTASFAENANYDVTVVPGDFEITRATVTVTADDKAKVYGESDPDLAWSVEGLANGDAEDVLTVAVSRAEGEGVGTYAITPSGAAEQGNYDVVYKTGTFEITKAELTVAADDKTKVYGEADPELAWSVEGLANGDAEDVLTVAISRAEGEDVGTYAITASGPEAIDNYTVVYKPGTFEITQKSITVGVMGTVDELDYNGSEQSIEGYALIIPDGADFAAADVAFAGGDASVATGTNVGSYDMTLSADQFSVESRNFDVSFSIVAQGHLDIVPAEVTVTAEDKSKTYDNNSSTDPELTWAVDGLKGSDAKDLLIVVISREDGQDAGEYAITPSGPEAQGNYTVKYEAGAFTIDPAEITIAADDKEKVYDNDETTDPELTATVAGVPSKGAAPVYSLSREPGQGAGEYAITVTAGANPNYTVTVEGGTFIITKRPVTVTADDKTKVYGEVDPELTATVTGLVGSDTISYTVAREAGEDVGAYTVTPSGAEVQGNYVVKYETGSFQITPLAITITADDKTKVYDNDETTDPELTATVAGAVEGDTVNYTVTREDGQDAGEYAITVTAGANPNYTVTVEGGTFIITKRPVTVTADDKTKVYDNDASADPELTATAIGAVEGVPVNYTLDREPGQDVGEYAINVLAAADANPNYDVKVAPGMFEITQLTLTIEITGNNDSQPYNGSEQSATGYTASNASELFDASKVSYGGNAVAARTEVGTTQMNLDAAKFNYGDANIAATFTVAEDGYMAVTPLEVTVSVIGETVEKTYDGTEHEAGFTMVADSPLYGVDTMVSYTGEKAAARTDFGVSALGLNKDQFSNTDNNFSVTFDIAKDATVTISPLVITVTIKGDQAAATYDGESHTASGFTAESSSSLYDASKVTYGGSDSVSRTDAGTSSMGLDPTKFAANDPNFEVTFEVPEGNDGSVSIAKKATTITVDDKSKTYGEDDPAFTGTVEGLVNEGDLGAVSYSRTNTDETVGTYTDVLTAAYAENANYDVTVVPGAFKITQKAITITVNGSSDSKVYNGKAQTSETVVTPSCDDELFDASKFSYSGAAAITETDVGEYAEAIDIDKAAYDDANLDVTFVAGNPVKFEITPAEVTVWVIGTTGSAVYNGREQSVEGYELEVDDELGLFTEDLVSFSGDATAAGTDAGTYQMGLSAGMFSSTSSNFKVAFEVEDGELTIERAPITIIINGNTATVTYNGQTQSVEGFAANSDSSLFDAAKVVYAGNASASGSAVGTYLMKLAREAFSYDDPNFVATFVIAGDGQLTIAPAPVVPVAPAAATPAAAPGAPAGPGAAPAGGTAAGTVAIDDNATPLAQAMQQSSWALLNLLLAILTALLCLAMLIGYFAKKRTDDEKAEVNKKGAVRALGLIPAIAAIALFIITEDMSAQMVMVDGWTIFMAAIAAIQVVLTALSKKTVDEDGNDGAATTV